MSLSSLTLFYCYCICTSYVTIVALIQIPTFLDKSDTGSMFVVVTAARTLSPYTAQCQYRNQHNHYEFRQMFHALRGGANNNNGQGTNKSFRRKKRNIFSEKRSFTPQRSRRGLSDYWNPGDSEDDLSSYSLEKTLTEEEEEKIISALDDYSESYKSGYKNDNDYYDGYYDNEGDDFDTTENFTYGSSASEERNYVKQPKNHRHLRVTACAPDLVNHNSITRSRYHHDEKGIRPKSKLEGDPSGERRRTRDDKYFYAKRRSHKYNDINSGRTTPANTYQTNERYHQQQQEYENEVTRHHQHLIQSNELWMKEISSQQREQSISNRRRGTNVNDGTSIGVSTNRSITNHQSSQVRQPSSTIRHEHPSQHQRQEQWERKEYTRQSTNISSSTTQPPSPPSTWRTGSTEELHISRVNKEEKVGAVSTTMVAPMVAPGNSARTQTTNMRDGAGQLPPQLSSHLFGRPQSQQASQEQRQSKTIQQSHSHMQRTKPPNNTQKQIMASQHYTSPTLQTMSTTMAPPMFNPAECANGQLGHSTQRPQSQLKQPSSSISSTQPLPPVPSQKSTLNLTPKLVQTTMSMTTPWARKFILSRPKDALLPIPREFLADGFNLVQLAAVVDKVAAASRYVDGDSDGNTQKQQLAQFQQQQVGPNYLYKAALRLILGESDAASSVSNNKHKHNGNSTMSSSFPSTQLEKEIQKAAEVLYTLLHARYISSPMGLNTIRRMMSRRQQQQKQNNHPFPSELGCTEAIFGRCPRVLCKGMPLLPYGLSDEYDIRGVRKGMKYCCSCGETFYVWESKVDGSAWGPEFCHLFLMTHGAEIFPMLSWDENTKNSNIKEEISGDNKAVSSAKPIPKIFGFRIHPEAMKYPVFNFPNKL